MYSLGVGSQQVDKLSSHKEGGASTAVPPPAPPPPAATPTNYNTLASTSPFGQSTDLSAFMGQGFERALTDESHGCPDPGADSDGDTFADGLLEPMNNMDSTETTTVNTEAAVKAEESKARGESDAFEHIADDDEDVGGEGGVGAMGASASKKRKTEVMKGFGEGASEAQKAKARYI